MGQVFFVNTFFLTWCVEHNDNDNESYGYSFWSFTTCVPFWDRVLNHMLCCLFIYTSFSYDASIFLAFFFVVTSLPLPPPLFWLLHGSMLAARCATRGGGGVRKEALFHFACTALILFSLLFCPTTIMVQAGTIIVVGGGVTKVYMTTAFVLC